MDPDPRLLTQLTRESLRGILSVEQPRFDQLDTPFIDKPSGVDSHDLAGLIETPFPLCVFDDEPLILF